MFGNFGEIVKLVHVVEDHLVESFDQLVDLLDRSELLGKLEFLISLVHHFLRKLLPEDYYFVQIGIKDLAYLLWID